MFLNLDERKVSARLRPLVRIWLCAILIAGLQSAACAQENDRPVLRVPWTEGAGFAFNDPDGKPRSFNIDLARMIGVEANIDIQLVEYPSALAATRSILEEDTDMLAGVGAGIFDPATVLRLGPVAETQLLLFFRSDAPQGFDVETLEGKRIGAERNTISGRMPMPGNAAIVEYDDLVTAFAMLLNNEVDAVLALSSSGMRALNTTGLDTLVRPSEVPVRRIEHVVALRKERADLAPRIEAAITRLEQSGELEALRQTWFMVPPPPKPDVLSVGVAHFPPYYVVREDGVVDGFAVELMRELASRAGLRVEFKVVSLDSWYKGPRIGAFDLIPARSVTTNEKSLMKFTDPVRTIDYLPFVRAEDVDSPLRAEDGRIGILVSSPLRAEIAADLEVALVTIDSTEKAFADLESGKIDALFYPRSAFDSLPASFRASERYKSLPQPSYRADLAIAVRPGLGDLTQRLNVVIRGYVSSDQYRALASRWFDPPVLWTSERIRRAQIIVAAVLFAALLIVFLLVLHGRRRALRHAEMMEGLSMRLGAVLDTTQSAILGFNPKGEIAFANSAARAMIPGLASESPDSWPRQAAFLDPFSKEPLVEDKHPIFKALAGSDLKSEVALMRGHNSDDAIRYVQVSSSSALRSDAGDIATVVILDDVSDLYESRKNADNQARIAAAAQKQESIGRLTGGIAHDFNNLLGVILGNLELLQDDETNDERAGFTKSAIDATLRGAELVRNMLAFARRSPIEAQLLDLNEVARAVETLAARSLPASVSIETSLLAGLWKIRADRSFTESALLNLIINASEAMKGVGRLTIETSNLRIEDAYIKQRQEDIPVGRYVMLAVSDDGPGIPAETLPQIFEPFFTTKGPQGGSGLGLSMVQGFMNQSGGTVRVYTESGVGTTFKLFFPAVPTTEAMVSGRPTEVSLPSGMGERVLVAEDQPDVLAALKRVLKRAGYDVVTASSGDVALEIFRDDPDFDVVVTDIVMPGQLQGPGLVKALRAIRPALPAIFMSGYAEEATVHGNGLLPTDIRLMKPVQRTSLLAAVERALLQAKAPPN